MNGNDSDASVSPSEGDRPCPAAGGFADHYEILRRLAQRFLEERAPSGTLQATALVHEAFLRMADAEARDFRSRSHFFASAAQAMRHALIDHLRSRACSKRGAGVQRLELTDPHLAVLSEERLLDLDDALSQLGRQDERASRVVVMKVFGGMGERAIAEALGVSERTVRNDWTFARSWLRCALADEEPQA
ncbi:MAG: sigma-70 family RNA polymerase sigma factor [Planctomycetes bacterium]|nr:sigma-70 family RNA polymerase sigma factor [Planctomycetota bacterium]